MRQLLMCIHFTQTGKRLVAHHADVFFARRNTLMDVHMGTHITAAGEAILTNRTLPFLFARVRQHVFVQMRFGPWLVSAYLALRVSDIALVGVKRMFRLVNVCAETEMSSLHLRAFVGASASMNDEWTVYHTSRTGTPFLRCEWAYVDARTTVVSLLCCKWHIPMAFWNENRSVEGNANVGKPAIYTWSHVDPCALEVSLYRNIRHRKFRTVDRRTHGRCLCVPKTKPSSVKHLNINWLSPHHHPPHLNVVYRVEFAQTDFTFFGWFCFSRFQMVHKRSGFFRAESRVLCLNNFWKFFGNSTVYFFAVIVHFYETEKWKLTKNWMTGIGWKWRPKNTRFKSRPFDIEWLD